jgi:signal transduction histidine kinase/DNA-binding response OmpR family regulator
MAARILVVDDDADIRKILLEYLGRLGYQVRGVSSVQEARQEIRDPFDLAIVDIVLPGESGVDLLCHIREVSPSTEVIMITGHATVETAVRALECGAFGFVRKPFDLKDLSHTVARAIEKTRLRGDNERLIAEIKESGARLEDLARSLEVKVDQRTHELMASREETERKARHLAIINEITNALSSSLDLNEVLRIVAREIRKLIQFDRASIAMIDGARNFSKVYFMEPRVEERGGTLFPMDETGIKWVVKEKKPLIRENLHSEGSFAEDAYIRATGVRSGIVIPLLYRGEVTGTLNLGSVGENAYTREHEEILKQIGGQIAVALENARLYRELKQHSDTLETRVAERTAALQKNLKELKEAQENLIQSEKLAATSKLIAGVAHEIRNPLNSMSFATANIQKALSLEDIDRARNLCGESISILRSDITRLKEMVDKFMVFTKPALITLEETDLNELIRGVVRGVMDMLRQTGITIGERYDDGIPRLKIERSAFHNAILNLLLNARDALKPGGRIEVRTELRDDRVCIEVEDDGCGIPPEIRDKVFDIFFTTKAQGTGLGLSQVYRTVESHKGTIVLRSEIGRGTAFRIDLPRA